MTVARRRVREAGLDSLIELSSVAGVAV
jgi:hypothetical protein